jgi:hypothetical protein
MGPQLNASRSADCWAVIRGGGFRSSRDQVSRLAVHLLEVKETVVLKWKTARGPGICQRA